MKIFHLRDKHLRIGLALLLLALMGSGVALLTGCSRNARGGSGSDDGGDEVTEATLTPIRVKTIHPRLGPNYQLTVERPAKIEAYEKDELFSRVPGVVRWITVAAGSVVKKGQPLLQLDVPDLLAVEREKASLIGQRERECDLSAARVEAARSAIRTAEVAVDEKRALQEQTRAQVRYMQEQYKRNYELRQRNAIEQVVLDETIKKRDYAIASELAAAATVNKALAEVEDAKANLQVAKAELEQKKQLVKVAEADHDQSKAMVDYAVIRAPFHGEVTVRKVNPGSFVQNASTGHPTPILTLERSDIVTAVMRLPDDYAPYVSAGTEAILEFDKLPGLKIRGKVTRFPHSEETAAHDLTVPVEVDLWNGSRTEYNSFLASRVRSIVPTLLALPPVPTGTFENAWGAVALALVAPSRGDLKDGPLPLLPEFTGRNRMNRSTQLMPGMYGKMTLVLRNFGAVHLIPSQAIIRQGGKPYIYIVEDGKAHLVGVDVQVEDGSLAKVSLLDDNGAPRGELTGKEEIVVSNQEELSEGQPLETSLLDNWKSMELQKAAP